MSNNRILIVNRWLRPVPIGIYGEIVVAGDSLSRGYTRGEETDARYLRLPCADHGTFFRTGDEGKLLEDGTLCIYGRLDGMIKVNGNRVEFGEIEEAILKVDGVCSCVVLQSNDVDSPGICAFVVAPDRLDEALVRGELSRRIPSHLIPRRIVRVDSIPLTLNGKTDVRTLYSILDRQPHQSLPQVSRYEEEVLQIFRKVLKAGPILPEDNFFSLGGNSLGAVDVYLALSERGIAIDDLYRLGSARKIGRRMEELADGRSRQAESRSAGLSVNCGTGCGRPAFEDDTLEPYPADLYIDCLYSAVGAVAQSCGLSPLGIVLRYAYDCYEEQLKISFKSREPLTVLAADAGLLLKREYLHPPHDSHCKNALAQRIREALLGGEKVIASVDCYHLPLHGDLHLRRHYPHNVLLTGFDDRIRRFSVIEHRERASKIFRREQLGYDDFIESILSHNRLFASEKVPDLYILQEMDTEAVDLLRICRGWHENFLYYRTFRGQLINHLSRIAHARVEEVSLNDVESAFGHLANYYRVLSRAGSFFNLSPVPFEGVACLANGARMLENKLIRARFRRSGEREWPALSREIDGIAQQIVDTDEQIASLKIGGEKYLWKNRQFC